MAQVADAILDEMFRRVSLVLLAALAISGLLGASVGATAGYMLGRTDGRQEGAQVACEPIINTPVKKPGIKVIP